MEICVKCVEIHTNRKGIKKRSITDKVLGKIMECNSDFITHEEDKLKKDLMNIINNEKWKYDAYKIEELAKEKGHTVHWLPPYHCELNSPELVWAQVKHHVKYSSKDIKPEEI